MAVQLILNELSCVSPAPSVEEGDNRMRRLLATLRAAFREGAERALRVREQFYSAELAPGIRMLDWRNLGNVDEVEAEFFADLVATLRLIDPDVELQPDFEFHFQGKPAIGLGIAYASDNFAVSFQSDAQWETDSVTLEVLSLDEVGDVKSSIVHVRHASSDIHVDTHTAWLRSQAEIEPFSSAGARIGIDRAIKDLSGSAAADEYDFTEDFVTTARDNGFFDDAGMLRHLLAESCARIAFGNPKNALNEWHAAELRPGWRAFRTHLTKRGPGYRLMFWRRPDKRIVFANVGPKREEEISYAARQELLGD